MSYQDEAQPTSQPTSVLHSVYTESVEARSNYIDASSVPGGEALEDEAHRQLQRATLKYLETLKHQLKSKRGLKPFWEGQPPTKEGAHPSEGRAYLWSQEGGSTITPDQLQLLEESDRHTVIGKTEVPSQSDETIAAEWIEHIFGLQTIDEWYMKKETQTASKVGYGGVRTETQTIPNLLEPEVLMRACEALDEAADSLNLLAEVEDTTLPKDEL